MKLLQKYVHDKFSDKTAAKRSFFLDFRSCLTIAAALLLSLLMLTGCLDASVQDTPAGSTASIDSADSTDPDGSKEISTNNQTSSPEASVRSSEAETSSSAVQEDTSAREDVSVQEDGTYTSKEEVALYLHLYGHLPGNYITKKEAEELGWDSKEGNLWDVAYGKSIGGSRFGNYEGQLPSQKGRTYYECDIDYEGGYRGPERLTYSNDGLIFYTSDHYQTFEQLY